MSTTQNKRRRLCGPKVKTGCQTCKIRRVKCDEARPSCWRCVNTGRRCDGYLHVSYRESSSSDEGSNLGPVARRVITISGSAEERRGFQFFVEQTAPELTGYLSPDFWEYLILQASVAVPSLKHTVIAIGSLHESLMIQKGRMLLEGTEQNEFAIKQYSKAIGHLRRNLAAGSEQSITALMSCLLFVCFDSLRGQMSSALVHLTSGFKILQDSRGESQANDHIIEKNVAPALIRSSVHSVLYFDTRRKDQRLSMMEELLEISSVPYEIPDLFEDIEEARLSLNMTLDQLFKIINLIDEDIPYNAQLPEGKHMYLTQSTAQ
ncbi:hypothetical protein PVAG01_02721 [Phlyctema vagabunda]|uniref:Zn(2)-C6 fungal-type domain-containing protein n=1 Tax=Phlyctema vagabunda TaxID=108571 RepID=A0ABR4PRP6_9HELO